MLEADKDAGAPWGDESMIGSFNEVIIGGAIALHFKAARSTIPSIVNLDQVEAIPFLAMLSLGGEYDGAMWWVRADVISACRSADADQFNKYKLMKMSWARVDKEKLHTVLFAPRFPGTVGAAADWDALKAIAWTQGQTRREGEQETPWLHSTTTTQPRTHEFPTGNSPQWLLTKPD